MDIKSILPIAEQGYETQKTEEYIKYLQAEYENIRRRCVELLEKTEALTAENNRLKEENRRLKIRPEDSGSGERKTDFPPSISTVNELFISKMFVDLLENSEKMRMKTSEQIKRSINDFRLRLE